MFKNKPGKKIWLLWLVFACLLSAGCSGYLDNSDNKLKPSQGFSFIYMSDSQADPETGDYTAWGKLLQKAAADPSKPAFLMIGGDLVNDGSDQQEWDHFFAAGGNTLKELPVYPTVGNHDNTSLYKSLFTLPANGPKNRKEACYSFDYKNTHFTVMDSNAMGTADPVLVNWLKKDLAGAKTDYKIVMFHHPPYPAIEEPKTRARADILLDSFVPVMEAAGVDLVLTGHQHVYMRTCPMRSGKRDDEGIVYLMGNSGGKHYTAGSFDYFASIVENQPVYTIVSVTSQGIVVETKNAAGTILDSTRVPALTSAQKKIFMIIKGDGIKGEKQLKLETIAAMPDAGFQHVYSTINNWPTARFYAVKGITVRSLLKAAGVLDKAQVITFRSRDGYQMSFTREQLLELPQYYYPDVKSGSAEQAQAVEAVIAYEYKEGSADMNKTVTDAPCLIIGQHHPFEHTNPAFVVDVAEIIVSNQAAKAWKPATTFPTAGKIAAGETVKLQHPDFGLVKLHYTLDGTDPTELSPMYNVSTYQPELNVPITITKDTVIKVLATGYGKKNSEIKSYFFDVQ